MREHERYELVGIEQEPMITYGCARASAFLVHFRECIVRPGAESDIGARLRYLLDQQLHDAYRAERTDSLHALQVSLNEILFRRFNRTGDHVERSPLMFETQQRIMQAQLGSDLRAIEGEPLPESADAFESWFEQRLRRCGPTPHPLFDFIETQASLEQFRRLIEIEAGVHVSFDDVIALAQVGVRGAPKSEFFRNIQDEFGSPDPDQFHLAMFERLVEGLGIRSIRRCSLPWEALTCGSYLMFLAYFRDFYAHCIGYLGCLEALTPTRFGCIARGGARLGVDAGLLDYHAEHSQLDAAHAQGWLHNIILPAIREDGAKMSRDIAIGVRLREHVAQRYWDTMLAALTVQPQLM